jgi:hypothetical protein
VGLRDVSGVFSREFVVGSFAPAFFAVAAIAFSLDSPPKSFQNAGGGDRVLIIGALALLIALLLNALKRPLLSIAGGHRVAHVLPLSRADAEVRSRPEPLAWSPWRWMLNRQRKQWDALGDWSKSGPREIALMIRHARLGDDRDGLRPTRLGNARLGASQYAKNRWGIEIWFGWPRVRQLLSEAELQSQREVDTDTAFFLNGAILCPLVVLISIYDEIAGANTSWWGVAALVCVAPIGAWGLYRFAAQRVESSALLQRVAFDLHWREFLRKMGAPPGTAVEAAGHELEAFWLDGTRPSWMQNVGEERGQTVEHSEECGSGHS